MVVRPCGDGNQCHRVGIFDSILHLLLLPDDHASAAGYHELEHCYVWWHLFVGYGLLCGEGEEGVHSSGEDCEAGCLTRIEEALYVDQDEC